MSTQYQPVSSSNVTGAYGSEGRSCGIDARHSLSQNLLLKPQGFRAGVGLEKVARRTLGIILLLTTVVLWTASNFLASHIFADNTYSKPFFVTYLNSAFFAVSLVPILHRIAPEHGFRKVRASTLSYWRRRRGGYGHNRLFAEGEEEHLGRPDALSNEPLLQDDASALDTQEIVHAQGVLSVRETAVLSLEFSILWFISNYFVAACLEYTSVASSTILTSTSSIWTLIFGAMLHVETFTFKKLIGVLASFSGIILISLVDLSGDDNDDHRGSFPHKSQREIAIGDILAFFSAVMFGVYSVIMKKRVENEDRVNMPLFFGLVGLFNLVLLWPGLFILHMTGVETFEMPPTGKVWAILLLNSVSSFVSDYSWAYAILLTTPLVVNVGLSLTIPLSLVGQIVLSSQYSSGLYWVGAFVVIFSFFFINHESHEVDEGDTI